MLHHAAAVNVAATYPPRLNKRRLRSSIPLAMEPYARPSALAGVKFQGMAEAHQGPHQVCARAGGPGLVALPPVGRLTVRRRAICTADIQWKQRS